MVFAALRPVVGEEPASSGLYLVQKSGSGIRIGHASIISNPAELFIGKVPYDVMLTGRALVPYSFSDLIESFLAGLTSFLAHKHTA